MNEKSGHTDFYTLTVFNAEDTDNISQFIEFRRRVIEINTLAHTKINKILEENIQNGKISRNSRIAIDMKAALIDHYECVYCAFRDAFIEMSQPLEYGTTRKLYIKFHALPKFNPSSEILDIHSQLKEILRHTIEFHTHTEANGQKIHAMSDIDDHINVGSMQKIDLWDK